MIKAIALRLHNYEWLTENINAKATDIPKLIQAARSLADTILNNNQYSAQPVRKLIERVIVEKSHVTISLNKNELLQFLNYEESLEGSPESETENQNSAFANGTLQITVQSQLLRCGKQMKLILGADASDRSIANPHLINLVVQAKQWFAGLSTGKYSSLSDLAKAASLDKSYVSRVITLAFLAPDILERIITGDHSQALTPERLRKACPLPLRWEEQRALLQV